MDLISVKCKDNLEESLYIQGMTKVLDQTIPRGGMPLDFVLEKLDNLEDRVEKAEKRGLISKEGAKGVLEGIGAVRSSVVSEAELAFSESRGRSKEALSPSTQKLRDAGTYLVFDTVKHCP